MRICTINWFFFFLHTIDLFSHSIFPNTIFSTMWTNYYFEYIDTHTFKNRNNEYVNLIQHVRREKYPPSSWRTKIFFIQFSFTWNGDQIFTQSNILSDNRIWSVFNFICVHLFSLENSVFFCFWEKILIQKIFSNPF